MSPCLQENEIKTIKEDISELKIANMGFSKDIQNLCVKMDSLIETITWAVKLVMGTVLVAILGLIIKGGL
jgi:hypothetical protein